MKNVYKEIQMRNANEIPETHPKHKETDIKNSCQNLNFKRTP